MKHYIINEHNLKKLVKLIYDTDYIEPAINIYLNEDKIQEYKTPEHEKVYNLLKNLIKDFQLNNCKFNHDFYNVINEYMYKLFPQMTMKSFDI